MFRVRQYPDLCCDVIALNWLRPGLAESIKIFPPFRPSNPAPFRCRSPGITHVSAVQFTADSASRRRLASAAELRMSGAAGGGASACVGAAAAVAVAAGGGGGVAGRLPGRVLEHVFSYLDLVDLKQCALVCWHWYSCLADENSEVWRSLCGRYLSDEALRSDILCNLPSYKGKMKSLQHALSSHDCSRNVYVKKNGFTLHRNPIAQSTDGARGKIGFSEGRHAWEIWWEGPLGTVAVIGIATKRAPMQCQGYVALLGSDDQSWGWNLVDNNLLHNGEVSGNFPQCNNAPKYQIGERIRVILDMDDKTLAFERGFEFLGVAFRGLPKTCLFPAVSAVYGNTEVTMVYLGRPLDG
ncbi:F-box/SPRY domain-containing protein 1 isoform X2 [Denticeps clupeoides]|uniref:F-box/SPRY domain-containing protein 1 n=2 Tax=Otomorpha TaxID=186634 RepID=A0AAY4D833_9TELE|nr:F-box/SPRY domain-containing protein 1 isoform X2 [Denticeps clupeoides]